MKVGGWIRGSVLALCVLGSQCALAEMTPQRGLVDSRVRVVVYDPDQVIKLRGYVGYQIYFQFAEGETFVNLAAGDNKALDCLLYTSGRPFAAATTNISVVNGSAWDAELATHHDGRAKLPASRLLGTDECHQRHQRDVPSIGGPGTRHHPIQCSAVERPSVNALAAGAAIAHTRPPVGGGFGHALAANPSQR